MGLNDCVLLSGEFEDCILYGMGVLGVLFFMMM